MHWHKRFYIAVLSILLFFLTFVSGDFALKGFQQLTWTCNFDCFGALGVGPLALTLPHLQPAGLAHGRDYSYCIASEHKCLKRLCRCSYLNYGNHLTNSGPHSGFFDPLPPDWPQQKKLKIERLAAATDISWHTAPSALSLCSKNQKWEAQNIKHEPSAADTDTSWNTAALQNTS